MTKSLINGDCLAEMAKLADKSVDLILTDPPYGTTACKWDTIIPFEPMWLQLKRIIKKNGAIVLFGSQPFTSALVMSNTCMFKYSLIWDKTRGFSPQLANIQPMRSHEDVLVFGEGRLTYNPQKTKIDKPDFRKATNKKHNKVDGSGQNILASSFDADKTYTDRYPLSIISIPKNPATEKNHPTQKPVALMEYLIRTYTNENETVLDFTMGSGTTGVACINTNRNFIGIELDKGYFEIATSRIESAIHDKAGLLL